LNGIGFRPWKLFILSDHTNFIDLLILYVRMQTTMNYGVEL